jgi:hypothetical protein
MSERAMPKPRCTEEVDVGTIEFGRLGLRVVKGRFDGVSMSSDAAMRTSCHVMRSNQLRMLLAASG